MQARPRFYFMMQMFIRNESQLLGIKKLHCDVPPLLSDCQMRRSQFNDFMTTVKSRWSRSVSISPRSDVDHRSRVFRKESQSRCCSLLLKQDIYSLNEIMPNCDLLAHSPDSRMFRMDWFGKGLVVEKVIDNMVWMEFFGLKYKINFRLD